MNTTFEQEVRAIELQRELRSNPDSTILVPAPEPRFEGHMIRVRDCKGPEWLEYMRSKEFERVRRYCLDNALTNVSKGKMKNTRYYNLVIDLINGKFDPYREMYGEPE